MKLDWDMLFSEELYIHKCFRLHEITQSVKDHHTKKSVQLLPAVMNDRIREEEFKLKKRKDLAYLWEKFYYLNPSVLEQRDSPAVKYKSQELLGTCYVPGIVLCPLPMVNYCLFPTVF